MNLNKHLIYQCIEKIFPIYFSRSKYGYNIKEAIQQESFFYQVFPNLSQFIENLKNRPKLKQEEPHISDSEQSNITFEQIKTYHERPDITTPSPSLPQHQSPIYFNQTIKPIIKKLYKKLSKICHPDRNRQYRDGEIFKDVSQMYRDDLLTGILYYSFILKLDIDFIEFDDTLLEFIKNEIVYILEFILLNFS